MERRREQDQQARGMYTIPGEIKKGFQTRLAMGQNYTENLYLQEVVERWTCNTYYKFLADQLSG